MSQRRQVLGRRDKSRIHPRLPTQPRTPNRHETQNRSLHGSSMSAPASIGSLRSFLQEEFVMHRSDRVVLGAAAAVDVFVVPVSVTTAVVVAASSRRRAWGQRHRVVSPSVRRAYSDSYLNDNWILVR